MNVQESGGALGGQGHQIFPGPGIIDSCICG